MRNVFAFAIVVVSSLVLATAPHATGGQAAAPAFEGTWIVDVSVDPSLPLGGFVALETYGRGGGLVTTNNLHRGTGVDVGQGSWERVGAGRYRTSILFFVFNADGSRAGTIEVGHNVGLATDQTYVGEGQATFRALDGAVIASGPFTSSGRKMPSTEF